MERNQSHTPSKRREPFLQFRFCYIYKKISLFIALFYCLQYTNAQDIDAKLIAQLPLENYTFYSIDHLGNNYWISNNEIFLQNKSTKSYKKPFLGSLSFVDIRNPLQLLLHYKDSNHIVLLDNQLDEIHTFSLQSQFPEINAEIVASANKNNLWIYDKISKQIKLLNLSKEDFFYHSTPLHEPIITWHADANFFYWISFSKYHEIDIFGKITSNDLPIIDVNWIGIDKDFIYYLLENQLFAFDKQNKKHYNLKINLKSFHSLFLNHQKMIIFTNQEILIFNLKSK